MRILETRIKHLTNDLMLTRQECETATLKYLDIHSKMEKKIEGRSRQLLEKESQYQTIFRSAIDGFIFFNYQGYIVDANPQACVMYGYLHSELTCLHVKDILHQDHEHPLINLKKEIKKKGELHAEYTCRKKDGTIFHVEVKGTEMQFRGDNHLLAIIRDITERKEAEIRLKESEEKFKMIFENANDEIAYIDMDGTIIDINNKVKDIFGYEREELVGKNFIELDILNKDDLQKGIETLHNLVVGNYTSMLEFEAFRKDGTKVFVETNSKLIKKQGEAKGILNIIRDITERKEAEKKLKNTHSALESSLQTIQETQNQLVQSEKMAALGSLVAGVSHEINTPLGVGLMAASFLEEKTKELVKHYSSGKFRKAALEKYLDIASESSSLVFNNLNRAADLVKNFKQIAVDQSNEECRRFKLKDYIEDVLSSIRPKFKRTHHTTKIECDDGIEIESYPGVFSQIITNFVMNSLTHGFEGIDDGKMYVDIKMEKDDLLISYKDNGRGVEEENLKMLFDPFFTTNRKHGGTGLGMYIVYNLVTQKLGGKIKCSSTPGKGIEFSIRIPLNRVAGTMQPKFSTTTTDGLLKSSNSGENRSTAHTQTVEKEGVLIDRQPGHPSGA